MKTTQTATVTNEQVAKCQRIIDEQTGLPEYRVESENDSTKEYTVKAIRKNNAWHVTCTCKAGQNAKHCKHLDWTAAAVEVYKAEQASIATFDAEYAAWQHEMGLDRPMSEDEIRALYVAEFAPCGV